jgi:hypothetical protein
MGCSGIQRRNPAKRFSGPYKKAFSGFSEEEISILNGIILEPTDGR